MNRRFEPIATDYDADMRCELRGLIREFDIAYNKWCDRRGFRRDSWKAMISEEASEAIERRERIKAKGQ